MLAPGDRPLAGDVALGSYARRIGLDPGLDITGVLLLVDQSSPRWLCLPAVA